MAEIIARNDNELTIQVTIKLTGSLLEMENTILDSFNEKERKLVLEFLLGSRSGSGFLNDIKHTFAFDKSK